MPASTVKRLEWSPRALAAFEKSLAYITLESPANALLVIQRVEKSLALIRANPEIGTPVPGEHSRRYSIANTGHVIRYRVNGSIIQIQRWHRARQERA